MKPEMWAQCWSILFPQFYSTTQQTNITIHLEACLSICVLLKKMIPANNKCMMIFIDACGDISQYFQLHSITNSKTHSLQGISLEMTKDCIVIGQFSTLPRIGTIDSKQDRLIAASCQACNGMLDSRLDQTMYCSSCKLWQTLWCVTTVNVRAALM